MKEDVIKIEKYLRINGWLNIKMDRSELENDPLYDFCTFDDGIYYSLSDAEKLYTLYKNTAIEK